MVVLAFSFSNRCKLNHEEFQKCFEGSQYLLGNYFRVSLEMFMKTVSLFLFRNVLGQEKTKYKEDISR